MAEDQDRPAREVQWTGIGVVMGAGVGATMGLLLGGGAGIALGISLGGGAGVVVGAALDARRARMRRRAPAHRPLPSS